MKIHFLLGIIFLCSLMGEKGAMSETFDQQRKLMVSEQLQRRGVQNPKVLEAMRKVERHLFVPPEVSSAAYEDHPLPIGEEQTISQPYIVAYMTEALALKPTERVLEIGTGSGYQAAILGELAAEVYSIEIIPELAKQAEERLKSLGYKNVHVKAGDGYQGWPEYQPFDAIIVTAAPDEIPQALIQQLKTPGGRMIVPVGSASQELILITKMENGIEKKSLLPVRFVPMLKSKSQ